MQKVILLLSFVLLLTASLFAAAPTTINYQGRLTDAGGNPVSDGNYAIDFRIYDDSTGGALLWSELGSSITTTNGLFSTVLGDETPFPQSADSIPSGSPFIDPGTDLWLEIEVNTEVQLPRTRLHAVPFSEVAHDLSGQSSTYPEVGIRSNSESGFFQMYGMPNGGERVRLVGRSQGALVLFNNSDSTSMSMIAGPGSQFTMYRDGIGEQVHLDAGSLYDGVVEFPDSAINSDEMKNEPGFAEKSITGNTNFVASTTSHDIDTVEITIPADGYIIVDAIVNHDMKMQATDYGYTWFQITETSNAVANGITAGVSYDGLTTGETERILYLTPVSETFYKTAGTYTFYLQGNLSAATPAGTSGTTYPYTPLRAMYFPTAYGSVSAVAANNQGDNPTTTATARVDPVTGEETTVYLQDLSYYEKQAAQKRKELLKAEQELRAARLRAEQAAGQ